MFDRQKIKMAAKSQFCANKKITLEAALIISFINILLLWAEQNLAENSVAKSLFGIFNFLVSAILVFAFFYMMVKIAKSSEEKNVSFADFTNGLSFIKTAILGNLWIMIFLAIWAFLAICPGAIISFVVALATLAKSFTDIFSVTNPEDLFPLFAGNILASVLIIIAMFLTTIFVFFVIARKSLQYSLWSIVAAEKHLDSKKVSVRKSLRLSIELSKGNLLNLFSLSLSFIGWFMLILIPVIIFSILNEFLNIPNLPDMIAQITAAFIMPYYTLSLVNAFFAIKAEAIQNGKIKEEDFE